VKNYAVLKQAAGHKDWPARIYFGGGTEETPPDDPKTVVGDIARAFKVLQADGVDMNRMLVNITPGQHDEEAWAARFPAALVFLFPASNRKRRIAREPVRNSLPPGLHLCGFQAGQG
jgi:hypothetical protein